MRILIAVALGAVLLVGVFAGYTELVERVVYDESVFAITALVGVFAVLALAAILFVVDKNKKRLNAKELEIKYREQLFGMLVDNTDDIYIMFSPEGFAVEYVSPNIEKLLGVSAVDVRHDIRALVDSAVDPSCDPAAEDIECLGEGECLQIDRERIRKNTGERRWYQETLYRESINGVDKYILVLSDRTREGMNSARLEQALAIARSSNEAKSLFLANMSHDIRTPINAIVGMARIAQESGEASEKVESCLHTIMLSSQHLLNLINDVLEMSRIESGQMSLQEERCTLDAIVEGVEAIIRPQAQARGQKMRIDCSRPSHREYTGDELRISQILLNLLSNAVKYTQEGGAIVLDVRELGQASPSYAKIKFTVSDNGMGMPEEFVERIFEPFERSRQASSSKIQGTGLGMSITKALVDAMGGTIEVDSKEGVGSVFCVTLDLRIAVAGEAEQPIDGPASEDEYDYGGKRFLLAEDNELNAEILIELLGLRGAEVEWAENGEEVVRMFAEKPAGYYDAVFMDVMMPIMNGYEAAQAIRASDIGCAHDVAIIALTANAFAEDVKAALDAGMDAHVAKPVDLEDLGRVLCRLCG